MDTQTSSARAGSLALAPKAMRFDVAGGGELVLLRRLGVGGFGSVYVAVLRRSGGIEQQVAVKILNADTDVRTQAVERLRDEARVLASLHHPVILVAHDLLQFDDEIALVTEYVEGQDLGEVMIDPIDPIHPPALIDVISQVAGALETAWSTSGIVHRDVKPANIRIGRHGNVKLLDFGIAKSGLGPSRTHADLVMGSLVYMAPERFERDRPLSPASDVFALGCVLFEGIAGRPLFHPSAAAKLFGPRVGSAEFDAAVAKRLRRLDSSAVRDLVRRMLTHDPRVRISVADVPLVCDQVQATLCSRETLRTWCRKRRWPLGTEEQASPSATASPVPAFGPRPTLTPVSEPADSVAPAVASVPEVRTADLETVIRLEVPVKSAPPANRWRWVGAVLSVVVLVLLMIGVSAVGVSAAGLLLIASG